MEKTTQTSLPAKLRLTRVSPQRPAGLWVTSLPVPRDMTGAVGLSDRPTYQRPLGQWHGRPENSPRRLLLIADGQGQCPTNLSLNQPHASPASQVSQAQASMKLIERSEDPGFIFERHAAVITLGNRAIGIALGLRHADQVHYWEACRMIVREQTPLCQTIEMAGAIPVKLNYGETFRQHPNLTHPFLHTHNWVNGKLTLRLHANGVCEVMAHHINSRYVDPGSDLADAVPVIGFFHTDPTVTRPLLGAWTGQGADRDIDLGPARADLSGPARLVSQDQPGRFDQIGDALVWQPYEGFELYGGACPRQRTGDAFIYRSTQKVMPRGMARTLHFSLSLSDTPAHVARYLAPPWWYGACEELLPDQLLPVTSELESHFPGALKWLEKHTVTGGFEDGSIGRYMPPGRNRPEPGWEGEIPYAIYLQAYRSADPRWYWLAARAANHFTDVGVDHSTNLVRMHGYPPPACSLPMSRVQGALLHYLETGDEFFFQTAEAVVETAHRLHLNSWPRLAVGRDNCFARSALMLYRYFNNLHFKRIGREGIDAILHSQRSNGSFGDQGGGAGIHQYSGYMTKPWMALLGTAAVLDWLELVDESPEMLSCVQRLADWFMSERIEHQGVRTWRFLHDYDGKRDYLNPAGQWTTLPEGNPYHHESIGRLMVYCALRFNRPDYLLAWKESRQVVTELADDHPISAALQFIPWVEARLLQARIEPRSGAVTVQPTSMAALAFDRCTVQTPDGPLPMNFAPQAKQAQTSEAVIAPGPR